jgi:hypothetical protein
MRGRSCWLLAIACLAGGCAPARLATPIVMSCQSLRLAAVTNPEERVDFPSWGYSLLPPRGNHWCVSGKGTRGVVFNTHPLFGQAIDTRPSEAEIRHTLALAARADEIPTDAKLETPADMFAFVEQRFLRPEPRFTIVQSTFASDSTLGAECIRFDAVIEERDNPDARGVVLIGVLKDNLLCRHPSSRVPTLVLVSASERYMQGALTTPLLIDTRRSEWEPTVRSLRFAPRP